jgi:hypothetical protein
LTLERLKFKRMLEKYFGGRSTQPKTELSRAANADLLTR